MEFALYIEINICSILFLFILKLAMGRYFLTLSADKLMFKEIVNLNIVFSLSNILTKLLAGRMGLEHRVSFHIAHMLGVESLTLISFFWLMYVFVRVGIILSKREQWLWSIPLLVVTLILLTNPFSEFVFSVDECNIYHRQSGLHWHWAVSWFYAIVGTVFVIRALVRAKTEKEKRKLRPMIWFIVFPCVAGFVQMKLYGISTTNMGITLGVFLVFAFSVCGEVSLDSLTGLNNRDGMEKYLASLVEDAKNVSVSIMMLDLNNFKTINDTLGHSKGDLAIKEAATLVKRVCNSTKTNVLAFRYGGDEFVIIGKSIQQQEFAEISNAIRKECDRRNLIPNQSFELEFSIGIAEGTCNSMEDIEELLAKADAEMYQNKKYLKVEKERKYKRNVLNGLKK